MLASRPACRVLILNRDDTAAQTRTPATVTGNTVTWVDPLPPSFLKSGIGNCRVELHDRRYTWLLTVRREDLIPGTFIDPATGQQMVGMVPSGIAVPSVSIVVFFNRSFSAADETLFPATFQTAKLVNGTAVPERATITCPTSAIKKGGYVFDADAGWWYRVSNFGANSGGTVTVVVDSPIVADSPAAGGHAMMMGGVVAVYPVGVK